jgi:ribose transport system substrate-binding protein
MRSTHPENRRHRPWLALLVVGCALALLSACGTATPGASSEENSSSSESSAPDQNADFDFLPDEVQGDYNGAQYFTRVRPADFSDWNAPKAPWTFCHSESFTGNTWRQGLDGMLTDLVGQLQDQGLATGPLKISNSDNDVNAQLSHINNFVADGCDVIFSVPVSPTGLCSAIDRASETGVLVITLGSPVYCKTGINLDYNEYQAGYDSAKALAESIDNKGNVLLVRSIPGLSVTTARTEGAKAALDDAGVDIAGEVDGNWTPSVAKSATLQFLSTHPQQLDGIWQAGLMSAAIYDATEQAGRDGIKVSNFAGDCAELAFWRDTDLTSFSFWDAGETPAYQGVLTALRILNGAKPVTNTLFYRLPTITADNLDEWVTADMTPSSTCYPQAPEGQRVPDDALDPLFTDLDQVGDINLEY